MYVCERWSRENPRGLNNFIEDMGETYSPGCHLDKDKYSVPDKPKCYSPETTSWVTPQENNFIRDNPHLYPIQKGDKCPYQEHLSQNPITL